MQAYAADLTRWYFQVGGIYLSEPTRDDYFALQDALEDARTSLDRSEGEAMAAEGAAFEFLRERGSALRTSLTRDVGTRKQLMIRGRPARSAPPG